MNFENWISYRYLIAGKSRLLSFLNFISISGVAIGVMALIIVTGVMTGFGNNLRDKIIGTTPHITVEKETGVRDFNTIAQKLRDIKGVIGASAYVQGSVFLENEERAVGLLIRGIDPTTESTVTKVKEYMKDGSADALRDDGVVIGSELASYFGYAVGDNITVISPGSGIQGENWKYLLKVVGIFSSGMVDYDMGLILVNIAKAQEIFNLPKDIASGVGVKITDPYKAKDVKKLIYGLLTYEYLVKTWIDVNHNLFDALYLEKWGLFLILTLMVLIASFNIISTLIVTVSSKIHDIGILQSIGVSRKSIRNIFTKQGLLIGTLGTFWGVALGLGISFVLKNYVQVPREIYSIDHVPVDIQLLDMFIIVVSAMVICYLATIYPSSKASSLQPVEALRYE